MRNAIRTYVSIIFPINWNNDVGIHNIPAFRTTLVKEIREFIKCGIDVRESIRLNTNLNTGCKIL